MCTIQNLPLIDREASAKRLYSASSLTEDISKKILINYEVRNLLRYWLILITRQCNLKI